LVAIFCSTPAFPTGEVPPHLVVVLAEVEAPCPAEPSEEQSMKVAVVGVGAVGSATALSLIERGSTCREIVLVDRDTARANGVASDLRYAAPLSPTVDVRSGGYEDLADAAVVVITAGVNEKAGGATDRADAEGRLRLLETNAKVFAEIVPQAVAVAPQAVVMVVTDPPDPLADLTRHLAGHDRVFSTGTLIDSLRFRVQLADRLKVRPRDVQAMVVGEHGTSEVLLWSSATVGGIPVTDLLGQGGRSVEDVRREVESDIRYANITIIEGTGASQYGIGAVSARLVEAVLRDERAVLPVAAYSSRYKVTLSLSSVLGAGGVQQMHEPVMTPEERRALAESAKVLHAAAERAIAIGTT
jgi:L-lactate dehydrogenase